MVLTCFIGRCLQLCMCCLLLFLWSRHVVCTHAGRAPHVDSFPEVIVQGRPVKPWEGQVTKWDNTRAKTKSIKELQVARQPGNEGPFFYCSDGCCESRKDHVCTRLRTSDNTCKPYKGQNTNGQVQLRTKYISDKVSNQPGGFAYILEMSGINDIYK